MSDYKEWSREDLLTRIAGLEALLGAQNGGLPKPQLGPSPRTTSATTEAAASSSSTTITTAVSNPRKGKPKKKAREYDVSAQPLRKIALRFSYDGAHYSGLAAQGPSSYSSSSQSTVTPLPTVEGVLWKALVQARLVDDADGYEGAGWSRCGRTDRGVSAAGQVVALWVRSRRVDERALKEREQDVRRRKWEMGSGDDVGSDEGHAANGDEAVTGADAAAAAMEAARLIEHELGPRPSPILIDGDAEELPYVVSLNRILPPTIRVHAWSPVRPDFSARFDCRYRHYKYFFTAGAPPSLRPATASGSTSAGKNLAVGSGPRLDVVAMRDAARRLLGSHDFRNLCKVDSSKQVTNFVRRVDGVSIDVVPHGHWPTSAPSSSSTLQDEWSTEHMYVFNLRGTAFLYHQVRHIMAVLFLVGARLESPTIVDELVNVQHGRTRRDRAAVDALRRQATAAAAAAAGGGAQLGAEGMKNVQDWIEWCLPGSAATDFDGHTANTRPGGPKADTTTATVSNEEAEPTTSTEDGMTVFETKPVYEMAADRPLVLWECGFRPVDVSWRAGTCDEPLGGIHTLPEPVSLPSSSSEAVPDDAAAAASAAEEEVTTNNSKKKKKEQPSPPARPTPAESNISAAWRTTADLHTTWTTSAISSQIARHFVLASPSPHVGTLPAWTHFLDAAVPVQTGVRLLEVEARSSGGGEDLASPSPSIPIGNGLARPHGSYISLAKRKRGEPVEVINARWVAGRGARRAAVRGLTAEELSRGMKPRIAAGEQAVREEEGQEEER
ncbi:unnamed protein product [Tilletia controversa]|uniref:Pseudouridine synthase I TruA alpha/beta domain-containing protein n=2 Tax=Tilletia TaxID=13289 RepID=A0A8X7N0A5_9BASI|nr:hypothetical protein CF328_g162 [Tilletia controversa]KAE8255431.1 hypothetical protein A4X06_0g423 [Tilletia controversa]CAD6977277.1 unnamed protein product [Tilletia controversa]